MMGSMQGRSHDFLMGGGRMGKGHTVANISRCRSSEKRELNFNQIKNFPYLSSLP